MTNLDKLEKFIRENQNLYLHGDSLMIPVPDVRTFFSSLLSEQERGEGWISVEERLPEKSIFCLALHKNSEGGLGVDKASFSEKEKKFTLYQLRIPGSVLTMYINDVTHWQPLPTSPSTTKEK